MIYLNNKYFHITNTYTMFSINESDDTIMIYFWDNNHKQTVKEKWLRYIKK